MEGLDLVTYAYEQGRRVLEKREANILKEHGQFLTPPPVARYMAKQLRNTQTILHGIQKSGLQKCLLT
jgi:hypothetical protein